VTLVVLDFETYFDQEYGLRKLTTEEYIRDPRFRAHLVGLYFPAADKGAWFSSMRFPRMSEQVVLCHHAHFDGLILSHHFDARPLYWLDTLSMARLALPHLRSHSLDALAAHFGLPAKTVPYEKFKGVRDLPPALYDELGEACLHDCRLTWEIFQRLRPLVPTDELFVIDRTIRMYTEPRLLLDVPRAERALEAERHHKDKLLEAAGATEADLQSARRFRAILESWGYPCPMKPSGADPTKEIPALAKGDQGMKALLEHEDPDVATLAAARLGVKSTLAETRLTRFIGAAGRGPLPVYLNHAGAHTLRWSGGDKTNWQNMTRGSELRRCVLAPPGHKLVTGDQSQIECRVLNYLARMEWVLDAFAQGRDLYAEFGTNHLYHRPITKAEHPHERQICKSAVLGAGFGMGPPRFREYVRITTGVILEPGEEDRVIRAYRSAHGRVVILWREAEAILRYLAAGMETTWCDILQIRDHRVYGPDGTYLDYHGLYRTDEGWMLPTKRAPVKMYGAKLVENVVQWLARATLARVIREMGAPLALTVHDELVYAPPEADAEAFADRLYDVMTAPPLWFPGIPLDAEVAVSDRYEK